MSDILDEVRGVFGKCPACDGARTRQDITVYTDYATAYCYDGKHTVKFTELDRKGNVNFKGAWEIIYSEKTPEPRESTWRQDLDSRRDVNWHFYDENWKDVRGDERQRMTRKGYNFSVKDVRINPSNPSPAPDEGDDKDD